MADKRVITITRYFLIIIFVIIASAPILPEILYQINNYLNKEKLPEIVNNKIISNKVLDIKEPIATVEETSSNRLIIKSIDVDEEIFEGIEDGTLRLGIWRKPYSALPSEMNGNVVIAGHRFGYLTSASRVFYHLDKVKVGDEVVVIYGGTHYTYQVEQVYEVKPEQVEIEDQSEVKDRRILTLYTCTPLWTSEKRLVVRAIFLK